MADDPDLDLVFALQAGDDTALNELMVRHREPLFRFLYRYTRNETVARDLAQEAFVRAYFKINTFKPRAKFSTWLFQIGVNLCRDYARSRQGRFFFWQSSLPEPDTSEADTLEAGDGNPGTQAVAAETLSAIQDTIDRLPHDLKVALLLTTLEEQSHKDVAEVLGVTPKTVETRVYRARRLLGEKLELLFPGISPYSKA